MNSFADFFWAMIVFYFLFMVIWIFIRIFADIFHRRDLTGAWKAIWILVLFIIPFFGAIVYMITRPVTAQDLEEKAALRAAAGGVSPLQQQQAQAQLAAQTAADTSAADQITKLVALKRLRRHHPGRVRRRQGQGTRLTTRVGSRPAWLEFQVAPSVAAMMSSRRLSFSASAPASGQSPVSPAGPSSPPGPFGAPRRASCR